MVSPPGHQKCACFPAESSVPCGSLSSSLWISVQKNALAGDQFRLHCGARIANCKDTLLGGLHPTSPLQPEVGIRAVKRPIAGAWHESLRPEEHPPGASDRSFGLVFAGVCGFAGSVALWHGRSTAYWWLLAGAAFLAAALVLPGLLSPLNRLWMWFGRLLYVIVNPVILAVLFYGAVMPVGLLMRAFAKDPLRRNFDRQVASYWIERSSHVDRTASMKNQF